jgi:hypothetical protein
MNERNHKLRIISFKEWLGAEGTILRNAWSIWILQVHNLWGTSAIDVYCMMNHKNVRYYLLFLKSQQPVPPVHKIALYCIWIPHNFLNQLYHMSLTYTVFI